MLGGFQQLCLFQIREIIRQPGTIFWDLCFPIILLALVGLAYGSSKHPAKHYRFGIVSAKASPDNLPLAGVPPWVTRPCAPEQSCPVERNAIATPIPMPENTAKHSIARGSIDLYMRVAGSSAELTQFYFDPHNPRATEAYCLLKDRYAAHEGVDPERLQAVPISTRGMRFIDFLLPGLIAYAILNISIWGISVAIIRLRASQLLKQMSLSPMHRGSFFASFMLVRSLFVCVSVAALHAFGALAFDVSVHGSLFIYLGTLCFGCFGLCAFAIAIATRSDNPQIGSGIASLICLMSAMISGVFYSIEGFPEPLRTLCTWLPFSQLVATVRAIYSGTTTMSGVITCWLSMFVLGIASLALAKRYFKWA